MLKINYGPKMRPEMNETINGACSLDIVVEDVEGGQYEVTIENSKGSKENLTEAILNLFLMLDAEPKTVTILDCRPLSRILN